MTRRWFLKSVMGAFAAAVLPIALPKPQKTRKVEVIVWDSLGGPHDSGVKYVLMPDVHYEKMSKDVEDMCRRIARQQMLYGTCKVEVVGDYHG